MPRPIEGVHDRLQPDEHQHHEEREREPAADAAQKLHPIDRGEVGGIAVLELLARDIAREQRRLRRIDDAETRVDEERDHRCDHAANAHGFLLVRRAPLNQRLVNLVFHGGYQ